MHELLYSFAIERIDQDNIPNILLYMFVKQPVTRYMSQ